MKEQQASRCPGLIQQLHCHQEVRQCSPRSWRPARRGLQSSHSRCAAACTCTPLPHPYRLHAITSAAQACGSIAFKRWVVRMARTCSFRRCRHRAHGSLRAVHTPAGQGTRRHCCTPQIRPGSPQCYGTAHLPYTPATPAEQWYLAMDRALHTHLHECASWTCPIQYATQIRLQHSLSRAVVPSVHVTRPRLTCAAQHQSNGQSTAA